MKSGFPLFRCHTCGFPRTISSIFKWNSNGTITANQWLWGTDFRVVFYRQGFVNDLFSTIEDRLGLSIEHIAFEAEKQASMAVFKAPLDKIPGLDYLTRLKIVRQTFIRASDEIAMIVGIGHSKTEKYVPGKYSKGEIRNPFNRNLMGALVAGVFELIEKKPLKVTWDKAGNDSSGILVELAEGYSEISDRMIPLIPSQKKRSAQLLPGNYQHKRCVECGTPIAISSLKWMEEDGVIMDTENWVRYFLVDAYFIPTVFRELSSELGEDAHNMIIESVKEYTIKNPSHFGLKDEFKPKDSVALESTLRKYIFSLPLFGEGNPIEFKIAGSRLETCVENSYEPLIIAATTQGLYEWLTGSPSTLQWDIPEQGKLCCTIDKKR